MAPLVPLSVQVVPGNRLDDDTVDEMWRLRTRIFRLKPERHPADDRAYFAWRVRLGQRNVLLRDREGRMRGTFSVHWQASPDGRALWVFPEYGFMDRECRGHPALARAMLPEAARLLVLARGRPLWLAGIGYPRSHQTIERGLGRIWTLADADAAARPVLLHLHEVFGGEAWDRETHRVWLPTIPEAPPPGHVRSPSWIRFERICPDWRQGYGLGLAVHVRPATLRRLVEDMVVRRRRLRGAGAPGRRRPGSAGGPGRASSAPAP